MCCAIHSFPYLNIISAFRCPELERARVLWWCLLWLFFKAPSFSFFFSRLETRVILERQMFLSARPCGMTCSCSRLLPLSPPYRVTAGLAGHCGRLRKRRGKSRRRLRIKPRWIPGGAEEGGGSHLLTGFQMTLLGSMWHERKELMVNGRRKMMFKSLSAHMPPSWRLQRSDLFTVKLLWENMKYGPVTM